MLFVSQRALRWLAALAFFLVCLVGPAATADAGSIVVTPAKQTGFRVSADAFQVGQFILVEAPAITAGSTQTIILEGPGGYRVELKSDDTGDGWVLLVLPPYFNLSSNSFTAAELTLTLQGIGSASISVAEPMTPQGVDLTEFFALGMDQFAIDSQETIDGLAGVDTSRASLQNLADAIQQNQAHFTSVAAQVRTGSLTLGSGTQSQTMNASQIGSAARLLYSYFSGLLQMLEPEESSYHCADTKVGREWWASTASQVKAARDANDTIIDLLDSAESGKGVLGRLASMMAGDDVATYAPVALPLLGWINKQYQYSAQTVISFMKEELTRKDLAQLNQRINYLDTLVGQVSDLSQNLSPGMKTLLGLDGWLASQQKAIATLREWYTTMAGDIGGGGEGTPLTQGFWHIDYTYSTTNPINGYSEDIVDTSWFKFDSNTGVIKNYGNNQPDGTYSLRGETLTMQWNNYWFNSVPCCFEGDREDKHVLTGTYRGGESMFGTWTKELPGGCYTDSNGACKGMPTTTKGWTGTYTGSTFNPN